MPKPKGKFKKDSVTMSFTILQQVTMVTNVATVNANPTGMGGRILTEADCWCHFRWEALRFRLIASGTINALAQVGYTPGVQDTSPGTVSNISELRYRAVMGSRDTRPTNWVNIPKRDLAGPLPWYKAIPGAADATEELPGYISFVAGSSDLVTIEFEGTITFKGEVATADTPEELALRERLRNLRIAREKEVARQSVLKVLSPATPSAFPCSMPLGVTGLTNLRSSQVSAQAPVGM